MIHSDYMYEDSDIAGKKSTRSSWALTDVGYVFFPIISLLLLCLRNKKQKQNKKQKKKQKQKNPETS